MYFNTLGTDQNINVGVRVLVTSNYNVAQKFSDSYNTGQVATDVYASLTEVQKNSIILNPYDTQSYARFDGFEHTLGFPDSSDSVGEGENNFQITLTLKDLKDNFEKIFVDGMIDFELTRKTLEDYNKTLYNNKEAKFTNLETSTIENLMRGNNSIGFNFIKRNYYFILINKNEQFLSPLVSEFYSAEVSQSSTSEVLPSSRIIKLKFICLGHPNLLSKLASIKYYDSQNLINNPLKNVKDTIYSIDINADLDELQRSPRKLDIFIKKIIKTLFEKISGKEVIIALPDFGKIYQNYAKTKTVSQLSVSRTGISNSFVTTYYNSNKDKYSVIIAFLKQLGFDITDTGGKEASLEEFIQGLPKEERDKLKTFKKEIERQLAGLDGNPLDPLEKYKLASSSNPQNRKYHIADNLNQFIFRLTRGIEAGGPLRLDEDERKLVYTDTEFSQKQKYKRSIDTKYGGGQLSDQKIEITSIIDQLNDLRTDLSPNTTTSLSTEDIKKELAAILVNMYYVRLQSLARKYNATYDFVRSTGTIKNKQSTEQSGQALDASRQVYNVILNFVISSKEQPQSGGFKLNNQIDFNEFANNFSNRLRVVNEDADFNNFNISYTEENILSRLNIISRTIKFDNQPAIKSTTSPCIVIFDQWLYENYYCPLAGFVRDNPGAYPISTEDLNNYKQDSGYIKALLEEKAKNPFVINGFLSPFYAPTTIFNKNPAKLTQGAIYSKFGTDIAVETLNQITPSLTNNISKNINPINFFYHTVNPVNDEYGRPNIVEYSLKADNMNAFASYNSQVKYIEDSLTQELLTPAKVDSLRSILGTNTVDELLIKFQNYFNNTISIEQLKNSVTAAVEQKFDVLEYNTSVKLTDITFIDERVMKDLIRYFGSKEDELFLESNELKDFKNIGSQKGEKEFTENTYIRLKNIRNNAINKVFDILYSFSFRSTDSGYKKISVEYLADPVNRAAELYNLIYNKMYTLEMKTFPMFQINNISQINTPAAVIIYNRAYSEFEVGSSKDYTNLISPLSGMYRIIGIKHCVYANRTNKAGVAQSEFVLVKNINVGSTG